MSACTSAATGILVVVALIHFVITVVLIALVVLVRCYCKAKPSSITAGGMGEGGGAVVHPQHALNQRFAEEAPGTQAYDSTTTGSSSSSSTRRRMGQCDPPVLETTFQDDSVSEKTEKSNLPHSAQKESMVLNNSRAGEKYEGEEDSNRKLRKNSGSSNKKSGGASSPFRRVSSTRSRSGHNSPLNRSSHNSPLNKSGRHSIASVLGGRKSADMSTTDPETVKLMASPVTSPTEGNTPRNTSSEPEDDSAAKEDLSIPQHTPIREARERDSCPVPPTFSIHNTTNTTSDC